MNLVLQKLRVDGGKGIMHTFINSLTPEFGNLILIRAIAVIRIFREADVPCNAKVTLTAKLRIVIILKIIG